MTSWYDDLLHEFEALPHTSTSIFDVAGYPHYENVCSNVLAFYFDPNNEHGLGELFYSCVMNLTGADDTRPDSYQNFRVLREFRTKKDKRIDLLIETDSQLIAIENKLYAPVYNPLDEYSETLEERAKPNQLEIVKVILSLKKEPGASGFACITYEEFFKEIRKLLGKHASTSSQKWLLYLIDFMYTVENLKEGTDMDLTEMDRFFIKNETRVEKLIRDHDQFQSKLNRRVVELKTLMEKKELDEIVKRRWIWSKSVFVLDLELSGNSMAFDTSISSKGWELELFGRKGSKSYAPILLDTAPMKEQKVLSINGHRYLLKQYDLETDLNNIKDDLIRLTDSLRQSDRNLQKLRSQ